MARSIKSFFQTGEARLALAALVATILVHVIISYVPNTTKYF